VWAALSGNGATAMIENAELISSGNNTLNSIEVYDLTLAAPLETASTSVFCFVRNTIGNYNKADITQISADGLTIRVAIIVASQQNGPNRPVPTGEVFYGVSYFSSALHTSRTSMNMFCYDPAQVLAKNTNPLPYVSCETFTGPAGYASSSNNSQGTRIVGATFDDTTGRLYLMQFGGFVGVYQLAS
jgi:hypothetical protein